jgi:hypothetical protein
METAIAINGLSRVGFGAWAVTVLVPAVMDGVVAGFISGLIALQRGTFFSY